MLIRSLMSSLWGVIVVVQSPVVMQPMTVLSKAFYFDNANVAR